MEDKKDKQIGSTSKTWSTPKLFIIQKDIVQGGHFPGPEDSDTRIS